MSNSKVKKENIERHLPILGGIEIYINASGKRVVRNIPDQFTKRYPLQERLKKTA